MELDVNERGSGRRTDALGMVMNVMRDLDREALALAESQHPKYLNCKPLI